MFCLWTSDSSPYRTSSASSRWPICVIPKSLYFVDPNGVNATLAAATAEITSSFNKLSNLGVLVRDFPSMGGGIVAYCDLETRILKLFCATTCPIEMNCFPAAHRWPTSSSSSWASEGTGKRSGRFSI